MRDRQGNALTGASADAAALYDEALHELNTYRGDPVATAERAATQAPCFVMARVLTAWLLALATEPAAARAAREVLASVRDLPADDRERSHQAILAQLLAGDWNRAATAMDRHNMFWPHDLLALQAGHLMDFYRGNARDLRDRIARALPFWSPDMPGYSFLLGMHAFGLEEMGDYLRAEARGKEAAARQPLDAWAHHAVAHVLEMQGRAEHGIEWMRGREPHWSGDDNFFKVHNWWHKALYHLDLGETEEVFALYDGPIRAARSGVALDLVDASALLWRMNLAGHDVGRRWNELAASWEQHADGDLYPYNDWHAAMALLGAGRDRDVDSGLRRLEATAQRGNDTADWARTIALPMIRAFRAFWHGDYAQAAETLHPLRYTAHRFGGSHAQRDIIDWTLTEAALRAGLREMALAIASERIAVKPHSPINRRFVSRAKQLEPMAA